jgi:two-component system sensor histidine kinase KdpD
LSISNPEDLEPEPGGKDGDHRPSPDALLAAASKEHRGRLKIFLGAAPGVGKTYAMLKAAQARRREGIDLVVAVVETHGRKETEALLRGLEVIPRNRVDYRGQALEEMDIDGVLKRRPKLALVDELAHSNVPGSRHPKRYHDVEELLEAGIDVYSTVNIQHLESLNDIVAQITRVTVRETLPDSVLERAEEVELVDLTPDALLQRLKEGKVYVPEQAQRAIRHFFSPGNLTALRELALRRTAERVDTEMVSYMQAHGISGPWPAGDRVMVCIDHTPNSARLVRAGRRIAERLRAKWMVVYVEGTRYQRLSEAERDQISETLRLAERLGGEVEIVPGPDLANQILRHAQLHNVSHIVIGRTRRSRLYEMLRGSVVQEVLRRAGAIDVSILSTEDKKGKPPERRPFTFKRPQLMPYLIGVASVVAVTMVAQVFGSTTSVTNLTIMYLAAVLVSALTAGLGPALFASIAGLLAHNYFFPGRVHDFSFGDYNDIVSLVMFLSVAILTSNLMARLREQAEDANRREAASAALYAFSKKLAGVGAVDDLLWAIVHQIAAMLRLRVLLVLPEGDRLAVRAGYPPDDQMSQAEWAAAKWAWEHNEPAGRGSDTLPTAERTFLPLRTARGAVGVLGIDRPGGQGFLMPDERRLLDSLADQAAMAIERLNLAEDMDEARLVTATERLRSALLTSISHDLRTPLSSIIGASTSLLSEATLYDETAKRDLLLTIQEEAERLNRFVGNLLDMTRLESGALELNRQFVEIGDIVGTALNRASRMLGQHRVDVQLGPDLPMLNLDFVLMEQVLVNLLDNAAKYSPAGSTIVLRALMEGRDVAIEIADEGLGIAPEDLEIVFDKFYRVHAADRKRAGTGLGLSICRGFIEAQGGRIVARSAGIGHGTTMRITFPPSETMARAELAGAGAAKMDA